jgi:hypothetical protein
MLSQMIVPVRLVPIDPGFKARDRTPLYPNMLEVYVPILPGVWFMSRLVHKDELVMKSEEK